MKHIKLFEKFKLNESGFKGNSTVEGLNSKEIENSINNHLSRFSPNIEEPKDSPYWDYNDNPRKLVPSVSLNNSKYGIVCDVAFVSDYPVNLKNINKDLFFIHNDIFDIVSGFSNSKNIVMSKFDFFGHKISGDRDGRTLQVQDITDEANDLVEKLKYQSSKLSRDLEANHKLILIQFIISENK